MTSQSPWSSPSGDVPVPPGAPDEPGDRADAPYPASPRFGDYGAAPAGTAARDPGLWQEPPAQTPDGAPAGASHPFGAPGGGIPADFLPAPKPGIIPLRPLSVGEIIGGAFEALRANPRAMFVPSVVVMVTISAVSTLLNYSLTGNLRSAYMVTTDFSDSSSQAADALFATAWDAVGYVIAAVFSMLGTTILTGLLIVAVSRSVLGRVATPGEVWQRTRSRILPLIGQTLLVTVVVTVSFTLIAVAVVAAVILLLTSMFAQSGGQPPVLMILLVIAIVLAAIVAGLALGFFLTVRLIAASSALVLENVGVFAGIRRSWQLTRGSFWRVLGTTLLAYLITAVISSALGASLGFATSLLARFFPGASTVLDLVVIFVLAVLQAFIVPFTAAVTALVYIDLRMRTEGLDVELRQAATS